jgi:2-polyprenyl-3-methyl-5-hydroxy-6-metoxy-1,4-benzoquinol methylase
MDSGSRLAAGGDPLGGGMPMYKYVGNKILTWLENRITGMRLSEFHSGYRLYSCSALKKVPFRQNSNEWHFDTDILIQFHEAGLRICERPIPTYYGDEICYVNGMAYAINCVKSAMRYRLHKAKLIYESKYDTSGEQYTYKRADPYSSHSQIIEWIEREKPREVLEVGTATGFLSAEMTARNCVVTGIEQDPEMAKLAAQHCKKLICADVENLDLSQLGTYDAIILGDVVEHLRDPRKFLQGISKHLNPHGKILMSLPNVANIWVRLNLLFGRFNYSRVGILDETHLRFFTLESSKRIAAECGLKVINTSVTPIPLPLILPSTSKGRALSFLHMLNWGTARLRKTLFGYQFILVCEPK